MDNPRQVVQLNGSERLVAFLGHTIKTANAEGNASMCAGQAGQVGEP